MKLMPLLDTCSRSEGNLSPGCQTPISICEMICCARRWYFFIVLSLLRNTVYQQEKKERIKELL
jgi:hypothetical protein